MKERNKSIFRILLFASVGILLAQTVLLATLPHGDPLTGSTSQKEMHIVLPLIFILIELVTCGMLIYFILNPQHNYNYTVRRVDGRWKWERIVYGPDPNGLRYISSGVSTIIIVLLFAAISAAILWPDVMTETVMTIVVIILMIPLCVTYCIVENKLRKLL
ncbi:MAG: hypothetical protein IJL48_05810 [Bacteroidales bacterium]|nr:hypothetical protein [Bacteroidales bacterium]